MDAVLTGDQLVGDGIGNLICGWMIHSKDGSPMKMGGWRALEPEIVRHVGQAVAVVVADTQAQARDAADAVVVDYEELPAVIDPLAALEAGAPQIHPEAEGNLIYDWEIGDEGATNAAFERPLMSRAWRSITTASFRTRWSRAQLLQVTMRPRSTIRFTLLRRIHMWLAWCCRPSTTLLLKQAACDCA